MDSLKKNPKVKVAKWADLERKINHFASGKLENFLVVADFDYTLTSTKTANGHRSDITYDVFVKGAIKKSKCFEHPFENLNKKYAPIEANLSLSNEVRSSAMKKWWHESNDLIISAKFKQNEILDLVKESTMRLRYNMALYLNDLEQLKIPLIIFSAGITNVIEASLLYELGKIPENVQIVSNTIKFTLEGVGYKFSEPTINSCSKNGTMLQKSLETLKDLSIKNRIMLLGDSLEDLHMLDGCSILDANDSSILKIGFLNDNIETLMDKFVENFDLIIMQDETMDIPRVLHHILFNI
ncbi:unnamed protein product [Thelazia callipaeda]|uniref:5'-nucleotidase n=1 Tax=Thelazia callipaeda TaxID=103827 RepID=A0A0N5D884_THECL|nr:unnamed protein product [Thelazia callipaeda]